MPSARTLVVEDEGNISIAGVITGGGDFLQKPFSPTMLADKLWEVLDVSYTN
jgi:FixJ family two-component response regulator